jgi:hypothetical protein
MSKYDCPLEAGTISEPSVVANALATVVSAEELSVGMPCIASEEEALFV